MDFGLFLTFAGKVVYRVAMSGVNHRLHYELTVHLSTIGKLSQTLQPVCVLEVCVSLAAGFSYNQHSITLSQDP